MRTTLNLDDELLAKAARYMGTRESSTLVRLGLEALIAREAGRRLIALGGSDPSAWAPNEGDEPPG